MTPNPSDFPAAVEILGPRDHDVLSNEALGFVARLHRLFEPTRRSLLANRQAEKARLAAGGTVDFPPETRAVRLGDWKIAGTPADLADRRVEITGPCSAKMVINALNSGARCFMACMEDATSPTWNNVVDGQRNLKAAARGTLSFDDKGKAYRLAEKTAVLIFRPRGWHLDEAHMTVDGEPVSGALFDFGLYFWHNARALLAKGSGPYFYLPKLEHYLEARLWQDVFVAAQSMLELPLGTIKATVLIETLPAAFMADEILFELSDHIVGLNCGRWDYIFSYIKTFQHDPTKVLPDRALVGMGVPFMAEYAAHVVRTCHRRGAHAMGGMSAFIPVKDDEERNRAAIAQVRADKEREARLGHDGTWVAHPGLVAVATEVFDTHMPGPNQLDRIPEGEATADALTRPPQGPITSDGLAANVHVAIGYLAAWLSGQGAVPLNNLMEDAATAEISRAQLWQWKRHGARLEDGRTVTAELLAEEVERQRARWREEVGDNRFAAGRYDEAADCIARLITADELADFLTLEAYGKL